MKMTAHSKNHADSFQVAIIEDAAGSKEILSGRYKEGLKKIAKKKNRKDLKFNMAMGSCAANIMLRELEQAVKDCSEAIEFHSRLAGNRDEYLISIAYSNRAIAYYLSGEKSVAAKDFKQASDLNKNIIVQQNLAQVSLKSNDRDAVNNESFGD